MSVTLDHLLMLAGRLDDTPGFDSPRERFRRFLAEHVRTPPVARAFIEQAQHAPGEQHARALQDLVILLGRLLGFQTAFGAYQPVAGALTFDGEWQSRGRLHLVIDVRSGRRAGAMDVDGLVRSVSALAASVPADAVKPGGLCVVASTFVGRHRLDEAIAASPPDVPLLLVTLPSLLALADMMAAGSLTHRDIVRLLEVQAPADFIVDLIERNAATRAAAEAAPEAPPTVLPVSDEPGYWIASVVRDHATRPEEFLELVVGRRQIFGIAQAGPAPETVARHDWICFYIAGKGVVGRAQVVSLADRGSIRDAHRFRQLLNVQDVRLHMGAPIAIDAETELRLRAGLPPGGRPGQALVRLSRESFAALTSPPRAARAATASRSRQPE